MADAAEQQAWIERVLGVRMGAGAAPDTAPSGASAQAAAPRTADPSQGATVRLAKSLLLWNATRAHVERQIAQLKTSIVVEAQDVEPEDYDDIIGGLDSLDEVMEALDDRLTDVLNELRGTTAPAAKDKLSAEARRIVQGYQRYLAGSSLVNAIDGNGFVPTDIKPRLEQALAAVLDTI